MLRRLFVVLAVVALTSLSATSVAAAEVDYPPEIPRTPSLGGSTATGECVDDAPWINFVVDLTDPDGQSTSNTAVLFMTDGANSVEVPLGTLQNGHLDGRVLWPGATVDSSGRGTGWPGWVFEGGEWVETTGNFAWTRGDITAELRVNPEVTVALSYPPASPVCAVSPDVPGAPPSGGEALPATGMSAAVVPIGIVGASVLLAGVVVLVARRRTSQS